jgi:hypothetical protein
MSRGCRKRAIERRNLNISAIAVGFNRGRNTTMAMAILHEEESISKYKSSKKISHWPMTSELPFCSSQVTYIFYSFNLDYSLFIPSSTLVLLVLPLLRSLPDTCPKSINRKRF